MLLIGSVATGTCDEASDIDVAILCETQTYPELAEGTRWAEGRPTEEHLQGHQVHYYAVTFEHVRERLAQLDDLYLYLYPQAVPLHDPSGSFAQFMPQVLPDPSAVRQERLARKLDLLTRRRRALGQCLERGSDVVNAAALTLEVLELCLHVTALADDLAFNPRKRLFETATQGETGQRLKAQLADALTHLGTRRQPEALDQIISRLQRLSGCWLRA